MKTNLGFKIKRKSNKDHDVPMKCYSCARRTDCVIEGNKYQSMPGCCDGFARACVDKMSIVECEGYIQQTFNMLQKDKRKLRDWLQHYMYNTLEGKHNITQQSDNWQHMEVEILAGLIYLLEHRESINRLKRLGRKFMEEEMNMSIKKLMGTHKSVEELKEE